MHVLGHQTSNKQTYVFVCLLYHNITFFVKSCSHTYTLILTYLRHKKVKEVWVEAVVLAALPPLTKTSKAHAPLLWQYLTVWQFFSHYNNYTSSSALFFPVSLYVFILFHLVSTLCLFFFFCLHFLFFSKIFYLVFVNVTLICLLMVVVVSAEMDDFSSGIFLSAEKKKRTK